MTKVTLSAVLLLAVAGAPSTGAETTETAPDAEAKKKVVLGQLLSPKAFRVSAKKVLPSLVTIEAFGGVASGQGRIGGIKGQGEGPTTGLVVSADGYVVTSTFNFIKKPPIITVIFRDGTRHVAQLVGRDDTRKICLLKVNNDEDLPVPEFVPRSELRVGQWAISIGIGYGDSDPALSAGIISATSRISGRAVQTDANISPANYGGPLIDIDGRVIGICVPLNPGAQKAGAGVEWYDSGIGFAVPLHGAEKLLASLKAGKTIKPGFLGVQVKPADAKNGTGVVIEKVQPKSAAETAELKKGDQIIAVNGEEIIDAAHLKVAVARHIAGETIAIDIKRGDMEMKVEVTLAGQAAAAPAAPKVEFVPQPKK